MRHVSRLLLLPLCYATLCGAAEFTEADRVVLPADKIDADITLVLPVGAPVTAIGSVRVEDAKGVPVSPQPASSIGTPNGGKLTLHLAGLYFWGGGQVRLHPSAGASRDFLYPFQRGPLVSPLEVRLEESKPGAIWLYNFDTAPLDVRWRVVSGNDSTCGYDTNRQPLSNGKCDGVANWGRIRVGAATSEPLLFPAPETWFSRLSEAQRLGLVELRFGSGTDGPSMRQAVTFRLARQWSSSAALQWLSGILPPLARILWVLFSVTLGAVLLMIAQVLVPNFRKSLTMENELELLEERLRAVSSNVGSRLYTRCQQELDSLRRGLAVPSGRTASRWFTFERLALAGNTAEISRLEGVLPRVRSRIELTERLENLQTAIADSGSRDLPPSIYWNQAKLIGAVRAILSRQFVTDAEEKIAKANLDQLEDIAGTLQAFIAELDKRVAAVRRQFGQNWQQGPYGPTIQGMPACGDLLQPNPPAEPPGGWSNAELIARDLAAVRLEAILQMIRIDCAIQSNPESRKAILKKLCSDDSVVLGEALNEITMVSQGILEATVAAALKNEMWDVYAEPSPITDQDVLRVWFRFRNNDIDQSAAKNLFRCEWEIVSDPRVRPRRMRRFLRGLWRWIRGKSGSTVPGGAGTGQQSETPELDYESGWQLQFIPGRGRVIVKPSIYDAEGKELEIRPSNARKGIPDFMVVAPPRNGIHRRLIRGSIDAGLTALVPVVTVAITQANSSSDLSFQTLVLLGFSSQAIRAAVVPESVTGTLATTPVKTPPAPPGPVNPPQPGAKPADGQTPPGPPAESAGKKE